MNAPIAPAELAATIALDTSTAGLILNPQSFTAITTVAKFMASGRATVPQHLRGNEADCFAVTMQAMQWRKNPFAVAQKTHLVNSTLGYEAQLIIAIINTSGAIIGSLDFEWGGDWDRIVGKFKTVTSKKKINEDTGEPLQYRVPDWAPEAEQGLHVICRAALRNDPSKVRELKLLLTQARTRNSTLWADDPKMQLAYLAGKKWGRLHCPEVILGMYSPDELQESRPPRDMGDAEVIEPSDTGANALAPAQLADWERACDKGTAAAVEHWRNMGRTARGLATEQQKEAMLRRAQAADARMAQGAGGSARPTRPAPAQRDESAAAPAAPNATTAADGDGVIDQSFVDAMNAAEAAQRGGAA